MEVLWCAWISLSQRLLEGVHDDPALSVTLFLLSRLTTQVAEFGLDPIEGLPSFLDLVALTVTAPVQRYSVGWKINVVLGRC